MPMFIAALFTTAKPRCPTPEEWIKKMWYLHTMKFYSAKKKNEILSLAGKWIELENIILSEVSQLHKAKSHVFLSYFSHTNISNIIYTKK
jgi:hypothetical protein